MLSIVVNQDLCTRCGTCSSICAMGVLIPASADSLPRMDPAAAGMCIGCGHCMAYCPPQVLTLVGSPDEPASLPAGAGSITSEDIGYYLKKRRSVRFYTREPVPREKVLAVLDIARYAASGGNGQPVEWIVIHDPENVQRVAGLTIAWLRTLDSNHPMSGYVPYLIGAWENGSDVICRGAPHLLAAHIPENNPVAQTDAIIALTHFDVAAPAFGIGTCWAGFVAMAASAYPPLQQAMGVPPGRKFAYAMLFGYPRYTAHGIPPRKPLEVTWA